MYESPLQRLAKAIAAGALTLFSKAGYKQVHNLLAHLEGSAEMNLIERLMAELGITRQQAEGGAGLLLGLAQVKLDDEQFVEVADSIPAISDIIGKAPRGEILDGQPLRAFFSRLFGGLGGLYVLARPLDGLGLDKTQVRKFVEVLLSHFREKGGTRVEQSLWTAFR